MTPITKNRIEWKNIRLVPIIHNRMEFAIEVRRQFEEFDFSSARRSDYFFCPSPREVPYQLVWQERMIGRLCEAGEHGAFTGCAC